MTLTLPPLWTLAVGRLTLQSLPTARLYTRAPSESEAPTLTLRLSTMSVATVDSQSVHIQQSVLSLNLLQPSFQQICRRSSQSGDVMFSQEVLEVSRSLRANSIPSPSTWLAR